MKLSGSPSSQEPIATWKETSLKIYELKLSELDILKKKKLYLIIHSYLVKYEFTSLKDSLYNII